MNPPNSGSIEKGKHPQMREHKKTAERLGGLRVDLIPGEFGKEPALRIDTDQIFLLYATFCGDVQKTAHAAGIPIKTVTALVVDNSWEERARGLIELKKGDKAGDVERGISRAMNFVQAHRYRVFLETILRSLTEKSVNDVYSMFMVDKVNKAGEVVGTTLNFKPLSDLSAALEKVHWMTYQALCDAPADRAGRKLRVDEDTSETDIHARISKALSAMSGEQPFARLKANQAAPAHSLANPPPERPPKIIQ